jgi:Fe-S cluster biogenesis protein NfuA
VTADRSIDHRWDPMTDAVHSTETTAAPPSEQLTDDERAARLAELMETIDLIRPAVQADGGDLVLLDADVATGVVDVQLQGACSSCAVSSMTLQAGIERILHDRHPWVTEVRGGVDDSIDAGESAAMGRGGYVPKYDYDW